MQRLTAERCLHALQALPGLRHFLRGNCWQLREFLLPFVKESLLALDCREDGLRQKSAECKTWWHDTAARWVMTPTRASFKGCLASDLTSAARSAQGD